MTAAAPSGMSTVPAVLALLAAALLLAPGSPARRRLPSRTRVRRHGGTGDTLRNAAPVLPLLGLLGGPLTALAGAIVAATAVILLRGRAARRERSAALTAVLAGLDVLIAELTVGAHPAAACAEAGRETAEHPVGRVFAEMANRARLGGDVAAGIRDRCPDDRVMERLAVAWDCALATGLPMAELLDATRADLAARARYAERTHAALAGARATTAVLTTLPLFGVGLGELIGAGPVHTLVRTELGSLLLLIGTGLTCAGLLWARVIVDRAAGS